jgi:2-polyprenyl-3-methyl-5-hydroxy-6-metoxy-1,4-benzoquinol methylase
MVEICRLSCSDDQEIDTIVADVRGFLAGASRSWDVIVFSSALHHLRHPDDILRLALSRLSAGGVVVTLADPRPTVSSAWFRFISTTDRVFYGLRKQPSDTLRAIVRRLRSAAITSDTVHNVGNLSEYHARVGIDDDRLRMSLEAEGFNVIFHDRYSGGYNLVFRILYRILRLRTSFSLTISSLPAAQGRTP